MSVQQACSSRSFVPVCFMVLLPLTQHSKQLAEVKISSTCSKRKAEAMSFGQLVTNYHIIGHSWTTLNKHETGRKHQLEGTKRWKSNDCRNGPVAFFRSMRRKAPKPPGRSTGKCGQHCEPSSVEHLQCGTSP